MPVKIGMVSLGCSKNLVDSERMLYKVRERGYEIVTDQAKANVVIVNTCGFIKEAKEEAIETILELSKLREEGTIRKIIATGCLVQRYKEEFEAEFANDVDAVAGIGSDHNPCQFYRLRTPYPPRPAASRLPTAEWHRPACQVRLPSVLR